MIDEGAIGRIFEVTAENETVLGKGINSIPEWVFLSREGAGVNPNRLRETPYRRCLAKTGLRRLRIHDLRHTFASLLLTAGAPIAYVSEQLGHASIRLTSDDGFDSKYPDLAFGEDTVAITWWDSKDGNEEIYLSVSSPGSLEESLEIRALRVTTTPGESIGAYIAWNAPRFGLAWNDDTLGQDEIYFQSFDSGRRSLGAIQQLTDNETHSMIPAIRPWGDGFGLIWNEVVPGEDGGAGHHGISGRSQLVFTFVR